MKRTQLPQAIKKEPTPISLHVGTPMYGGMCTGTYTSSMLRLVDMVKDLGMGYGLSLIYNESLITRARNRIVDAFLKTTNNSHLLWCDADIGFEADEIMSMLAQDKDIIGAACVRKALNWPRLQAFIKKHPEQTFSEQDLMNVSGEFVVQWLPTDGSKQIHMADPFEVKRLGTGLLIIKREVFLKLREANPARQYSGIGDPTNLAGPIHDFFEARIDPESKEYLSEDYAFCDDARALGFKVWLAPWVKSSHYGNFKYEANLLSVATGMGSL